MLFKILVIAMLVLIVSSLVSGLVFLMRDDRDSTRTVKALTVRIGLSVALFLLLMAGMATGLITPHGIGG